MGSWVCGVRRADLAGSRRNVPCPIVFRGPNGAAAGVGAQHSQDYACQSFLWGGRFRREC